MKRHTRVSLTLPLLALLSLLASGCAVEGGVSNQDPRGVPASMSAAELGLPAPLRPFHDELEPYGDWVLIEPYGWVFRPRVNTVAWRPYQDGRWVPSYSYGWVWESNEEFGWITDHYGFWFHDPFQGWVWQPYGAWAPSWVAWVQVGDYVGWAPLAPSGTTGYGDVPGGLFTFVNSRTLAAGGATTRASYTTDMPDDVNGVRPIDRVASRQGVYWNAGPDPDAILGRGANDRLRVDERDGRVALPAPSSGLEKVTDVDLSTLQSRTMVAWREARRELEDVRARRPTPRQGQSAAPPASSPPPATAPAPQRIKPAPSPRDTSGEPDSLARLKRALKPGAPRPPRRNPR